MTSGLELSRSFYQEAVRPLITDLPHSAARIGSGSDVLGYDDAMSTDHDWGCRLQLFFASKDLTPEVDRRLRQRLPRSFRGFPTSFSDPDPSDRGTRLWSTAKGEVNHNVDIETIPDFLKERIGGEAPNEIDWLLIPEQRLLSVTSGEVFHDDLGLVKAREELGYFPRDVWLYLMAAGWTRIGQEQHLMGRAGFRGDELGSAIIATRLVRDVMRLCFMYERRYAPYPKWFGTAFAALPSSPRFTEALNRAAMAKSWQERESGLTTAYGELALLHHEDPTLPRVDWSIGPFFGRPFQVILGNFAGKLASVIEAPDIQRLASRRLIGGVDQVSDSTDILEDLERIKNMRSLYT